MAKDVIIACDFNNAEETFKFLDKFEEKKPFVKIGMELYYSEGPDIVRQIKKRGHKIFLDLKLHDIPNTVKKAMKVLAALDVDMLNLHAAGGSSMMKAAFEGYQEGSQKGKAACMIAVTQLTSINQEKMENELLIKEELQNVVISYAKNAKNSGLQGIVCSPLEAGLIHENCGENFITVTPGIRFSDDSKGDQQRVTTPAKAKQLGSDYIVVGRSITAAENPVEAYQRCLKDFIG